MFRRVPAALHAALAVTLLLAGVAPFSDEASAQGTSDAAHRCQQGGYLVLIPMNRPPFRNTGDCIHYLSDGGLVMSSARKLAFSYSPVPPGMTLSWSNLIFTGSGFAPTTGMSSAFVTLTLRDMQSGSTFALTPFGTDSNGGFMLSGAACSMAICGPGCVCIGNHDSMRMTGTDGFGIASVDFPSPC